MATTRRQTRGGRSQSMGGTLSGIVRSTLAQASVVRDVLERGAREGKARLDDVRRDRRRQEALAELGELALGLLRDGDARDLEHLPGVQSLLAELDQLDDDAPVRGRAADTATGGRRSRFDARDDGTVSSGARARREAGAGPAVGGDLAGRGAPARRPGGIELDDDDDGDDAGDGHGGGGRPQRGDDDASDPDPDADLSSFMHPDDVASPAKRRS